MDLLKFLVLPATVLDELVIFPVSELIGFQAEFIRLYVLFLATFPLGVIMHYCVYGKTARHLFSMIMGILMQAYLYRYEVLHTAAITTGTILIINLVDR